VDGLAATLLLTAVGVAWKVTHTAAAASKRAMQRAIVGIRDGGVGSSALVSPDEKNKAMDTMRRYMYCLPCRSCCYT